MQDKYVSLDPANEESNAKSRRSALYSQRLEEARGGELGVLMGGQFFLTASISTWAALKARGHSFSPFGATKLPLLVKIIVPGLIAYQFGNAVAGVHTGSALSTTHLATQRAKIFAGEESM